MTKTITTTFRQQVLNMFYDPTKEYEVDELPKGQRSIYCEIHDLRTRELFADACKQPNRDVYFEHSLDPLTDEERNKLDDYQDIFYWDERIFIESTWITTERFDCEVEEGLGHALEIIKKPYKHEDFLGIGLEDINGNCYLQTLQPTVEIDNLRLKEKI